MRHHSIPLAIACLSVFLTGCPSDTPVSASPQAMPPAIAGNAQAATAASAAPSADAIKKQQLAQKEAQLIAQVDRTYQSGVTNYRNGRLDAARLDFDFAVDLMLTSGMDLKGDDALSDEFERTVSAINSLELDALKQGNGFSPKVEESPVEAAGELTFPSNPELTAKLKQELQTTQSDLPLVVNDYVAGYISYFTNNSGGRAHLARSLERAGKYKDMIQRIFREEGVPQDFIYQAVAESGFQPQALNAKSGAAGMWQFMPFRGAYGLDRNGYYDERFDPEKSTRAYARYMKELYNQLGDWYLVMAGYDWGPGNVQRAVMRTGYADFWQLYRHNALPGETKNYVPAMIAAAIMAKNPSQYGLDHLNIEPAVVYDTVTVNTATDLRLVADITESQLTTIVGLNPSLLRLSTPRDMSFDLHIPKGTQELYNKRIADIPDEKRDTWRFHKALPGETLDQVAQLFHVHTHELAVANELKDDEALDPGDELVVPVEVVTTASAAHPQQYRVHSGDTLVTIADRFGVTLDQLRRWNHLSGSSVTSGRTISVAEPVRLAPTARAHERRGRHGRADRGSSRASSSSSSKSSRSSKKTAPAPKASSSSRRKKR